MSRLILLLKHPVLPAAALPLLKLRAEKVWFSFYDYTHTRLNQNRSQVNDTITGHLIYNSFLKAVKVMYIDKSKERYN